MSASLDLLRTVCPDLDGETDQRCEDLIEIASRRLTPTVWGAVYMDAVVFLAAHLLIKNPAGGSDDSEGVNSAGGITARKAGDLSKSYGSAGGLSAQAAFSDRSLMETFYGREFLALRDTRAAGMPWFATPPSTVEEDA